MSSFTLVNETCVIPNLLVNKLYWFPLTSIMDKKTMNVNGTKTVYPNSSKYVLLYSTEERKSYSFVRT